MWTPGKGNARLDQVALISSSLLSNASIKVITWRDAFEIEEEREKSEHALNPQFSLKLPAFPGCLTLNRVWKAEYMPTVNPMSNKSNFQTLHHHKLTKNNSSQEKCIQSNSKKPITCLKTNHVFEKSRVWKWENFFNFPQMYDCVQ